MIGLDLAISLFEEAVSVISGNRDYQLVRSNSSNKMISGFLTYINSCDPTSGSNYMKRYLYFQMSRYYKSDRFNGVMSVSWIFGKKAIDMWLLKGRKMSIQDMLIYNDGIRLFRSEVSISKIADSGYPDIQDAERSRFSGDDRLIHCSDYTTMADPSSVICKECESLDMCKTILNDVNKSLYESRFVVKEEVRVEVSFGFRSKKAVGTKKLQTVN